MTAGPGSKNTGKRAKYILILGSLVLAALALIAWTQTWLSVSLAAGAPVTSLPVDGTIAAPALSALALAGLALAAALAIAGLVFRIVLGVLEALLGACVALSAVLALVDPVAASEAAITSATGVAGSKSTADLVAGTTLTPWPWITLATGILLVALGVATALTATSWPSSARKYSAVRLQPAENDEMPDSVDSWDDLTRGDDPTR